MADFRMAWASLASPTYHPSGLGSTKCSVFPRTDPEFEPSLHQHWSPLSGNAISRGRDKGAETADIIQSTVGGDKIRARIPPVRGPFAINREISVCVGLCGGDGRTRTACVAISHIEPALVQVRYAGWSLSRDSSQFPSRLGYRLNVF
jgi:hypothetical protein